MDNLFKIRTLTTAVNEMQTPENRIFNRLFKPKENMQGSDRLACDIISGSDGLLSNISVSAPCQVTAKTGRRVVTVTAPRLGSKRFIATSELNSMRQMGDQIAPELLKDRIAREQLDMRGEADRTKEFFAANVLQGKILDSDGTTVLVDYNLPASHKPVLTGTDVWTDTASDPLVKIRELKRLIEDDHKGHISGWLAYLGAGVMDALLGHAKVRDLIKNNRGAQVSDDGRITKLAEVELDEYSGSYLDANSARQRFIPNNVFALIGIGDDVFDCPFAPIVDKKAPGGVGNVINNKGVPFFSKAWDEEDPDGTWIKVETRPLPWLKRVGAVVWAEVIA